MAVGLGWWMEETRLFVSLSLLSVAGVLSWRLKLNVRLWKDVAMVMGA